ncbi:MAG: TldD/PmbA family protein [Alphaproteobacteria bacterium]|jgi:PmbA protein|tara:strand:+ start:141 stop:1451 length:1311 start_codon:yes stop_codon:yes gene_type:complete
MSDTIKNSLNLLLDTAKKLGAESAAVMGGESTSINVTARLGKLESVERNESKSIGLQLIDNKRKVNLSSTNFNKDALIELVESAMSMIKSIPEDEFCGLADKEMLYKGDLDLDLVDNYIPENNHLLNNSIEAEDSALSINGVTNSEGASSSYSKNKVFLATSDGFYNYKEKTNYSSSISVIAGSGTKMERDYEYQSKVHNEDLDTPKNIGEVAANRAVSRLNPKKVKSNSVPIIFDPRVSGSLLSLFTGGISGQAVARGTSFLKDKMEETIFTKDIQIIDDPHVLRGQGSRTFDGEGVETKKIKLINNGTLKSWLLSSQSARQLNLKTTGHSSGVSNLYMEPGNKSNTDLISSIKEGFYVTEMMGMSFNQVTGDYSRGATGFWIEKGEKTYPVSEVTIAGNIIDMYSMLTPASDLKLITGIDAPTILIEKMMVAGL